MISVIFDIYFLLVMFFAGYGMAKEKPLSYLVALSLGWPAWTIGLLILRFCNREAYDSL